MRELPPSVPENGGGDVWARRLHGDLGACDSMLLPQPDSDDRWTVPAAFPDPRTHSLSLARGTRRVRVLCPLTRFRFSLHIGLSLAPWLPRMARASTLWKNSHQLHSSSALVGLAVGAGAGGRR